MPVLQSTLSSCASSAAALAKITLALPKDKRDLVEATAMFAPSFHIDGARGERLESIRQAIARRSKLELQYIDAKDKTSQRIIWPLAMVFWGGVWPIATACETHDDFRSFRLDRIQDFQIGKSFTDQSWRRLSDFNHAVRKGNARN